MYIIYLILHVLNILFLKIVLIKYTFVNEELRNVGNLFVFLCKKSSEPIYFFGYSYTQKKMNVLVSFSKLKQGHSYVELPIQSLFSDCSSSNIIIFIMLVLSFFICVVLLNSFLQILSDCYHYCELFCWGRSANNVMRGSRGGRGRGK